MGRWTFYHPVVFLLTFFSYAFFHATRKTFSNVKTTIAAEWTPSPLNNVSASCTPYDQWNKRHLFDTKDDAEKFMGILDASFMFAYAVGLYLSGFIADRHDLRIVLGSGMCLTAVTVFMFGPVFEWTHFYSKPAYVAVWILNGLLQSSGWPSVVAVMGNWFGKGSRGLILGIWSACASVGNIIGALMVTAVLDYGYEYAFMLTSAVLFAGGLFNYFGLVPSPRDVGLPMPDEGPESQTDEASSNIQRQPLLQEGDEEDDGLVSETVIYSITDTRPKAIGFFRALLLPGVIPYALSYAFLKLVNYSFFFWLPFYLSGAYGLPETTADEVSIWYDIGGIIGGTIAGFISDRLQKRGIVVVPMLILAVPMLFIYGLAGIAGRVVINCVMLTFVGLMIGGVANLISAAISADLGRQKQLQGNSEALSTVTGIVDGTGSLGAALGQVAVPYLQVSYGWRSVFYLFMVTTFLTAVCIAPVCVQELRDLGCRCSRSRQRGAGLATEDDKDE
ncbi:hypothetical protein BaRGS_00015813 [Batillaria attramentaria]|uniref:Sugar phosphate exchanger 3 n=1 Tax=Batillaria attramentaria TaxID=370345 RepID=A0ABD0L029_9CAEN